MERKVRNFFLGDTAIYEGSILGDCQKTIFNSGVQSFKVQHKTYNIYTKTWNDANGKDDWCLEKVTIDLTGGESISCTEMYLDGEDSFMCSKNSGK